MTVTITGTDLTIEEIVRVARQGEKVALGAGVIERMRRCRAIVENARTAKQPVYGLNTGLGVLKRTHLSESDDGDGFNRRTLHSNRLAQGPAASPDIGRAQVLRQINHFALGTPGVRPELAARLVEYLNQGGQPRLKLLGGSLHTGADAAVRILSDFKLAPNEGLALMGIGALGGHAALAFWDARVLMEAMDASGALAFEAFAGQADHLHPHAVAVRPYPGFAKSLSRIRGLLEGSFIWRPGAARNLQDPASFRALAQIQGALHDVMDFAAAQFAVQLNASQGNPIVVLEEERVISAANFDLTPLLLALDSVRTAFGTALIQSQERTVKLLDKLWSGLPTGLTEQEAVGEAGLSIYQVLVAHLTPEANLLSQPVTNQITTTSIAEGVSDRWYLTSLAARRLEDLVMLGEHIAAAELIVAAQAVELRGLKPLGRGTAEIVRLVRSKVPFLAEGVAMVSDLSELRALIRSGAIGAQAKG